MKAVAALAGGVAIGGLLWALLGDDEDDDRDAVGAPPLGAPPLGVPSSVALSCEEAIAMLPAPIAADVSRALAAGTNPIELDALAAQLEQGASFSWGVSTPETAVASMALRKAAQCARDRAALLRASGGAAPPTGPVAPAPGPLPTLPAKGPAPSNPYAPPSSNPYAPPSSNPYAPPSSNPYAPPSSPSSDPYAAPAPISYASKGSALDYDSGQLPTYTAYQPHGGLDYDAGGTTRDPSNYGSPEGVTSGGTGETSYMPSSQIVLDNCPPGTTGCAPSDSTSSSSTQYQAINTVQQPLATSTTQNVYTGATYTAPIASYQPTMGTGDFVDSGGSSDDEGSRENTNG